MVKKAVVINNKLVTVNDKVVDIEGEEHGIERHLFADFTFSSQSSVSLSKTVTIANVMHEPMYVSYCAYSANNTYAGAIYSFGAPYPLDANMTNAYLIVRGPSRATSPKISMSYDATNHTLTLTVNSSNSYDGFNYNSSPELYIVY